ncbi:hypothetical protein BDW67DRAFT_192405 [Aspergillus spinulosporus]
MRAIRKLATILLGAEAIFLWLSRSRGNDNTFSPAHYPLLTKYVASQAREGVDGVWHIPPEWITDSDNNPLTIVEAAETVRNKTTLTHLPHSLIPPLVHQTWKNTDPETWSDTLRRGTERWLRAVEEDGMAYFLWDDGAVAKFIQHFEPELLPAFYALPNKAEQSDVFRILVSKWIGGTYGDMDTEPIRSPAEWVTPSDLEPWHDPGTDAFYNSTEPVRAIIGLEAVCSRDSDMYWRMGYEYPVQLTQWSFSWAPGHPVLQHFLDNIVAILQDISSKYDGNLLSPSAQRELYDLDPLTLTGPPAFTLAVGQWLESTNQLHWDALATNAEQSKLVGDVLVLPITGFSPGRGFYGNMGSKPVSDSSARLMHYAQGSWKKTSLLVEYGKFCRTVFGFCKNWSKVPHNLLW